MIRKFSQSDFSLGICLVLLLGLCLGCVGSKSYSKHTEEAVDKIIKEDPLFKEFDKLCSEVPLPDDFSLLGKKGLYNIKGILYYYSSDTKPSKVKEHFTNHFYKRGWKTRRSKSTSPGDDFTDGRLIVGVQYSADYADYTLYCGLLKKIDKQDTWNER